MWNYPEPAKESRKRSHFIFSIFSLLSIFFFGRFHFPFVLYFFLFWSIVVHLSVNSRHVTMQYLITNANEMQKNFSESYAWAIIIIVVSCTYVSLRETKNIYCNVHVYINMTTWQTATETPPPSPNWKGF